MVKITREQLLVVFIIFFAGLIRFWRIDTDLLIHYDQGRDLIATYNIWHNHQPTLLGPTADDETKGIFFGPLYYYLISIPLFLTNGNPVSAIILLIFLELVSLFFFYLGVKKIFNSKIAIFSLILYSASFGLVSYSRWLSNAMPVLAIGNILIYLIGGLINKEKIWFFWWLTLGLIFAFNPAAGIGIFVFGLVWQITQKPKFLDIPIGIFAFLLPSLPQIIFELRHNFLVTRGIWKLFTHPSEGLGLSFAIIDVLNRFVTGIWWYQAPVIGSICLSIIVLYQIVNYRKPQSILFLLAATQVGILLLFRRPLYGHFLAAIAPSLIILLVVSLINFGKQLGYIIVTLLVFVNLSLDYLYLKQPNLNLTPIGTANLVTLGNRLKIVDYISNTSKGRTYSMWTYTIPYFQDQAWHYLLKWKGVDLPAEKGELFYSLYERDWDRPTRLESWKQDLNNISIVIDSKKSGDFTIEQRRFIKK